MVAGGCFARTKADPALRSERALTGRLRTRLSPASRIVDDVEIRSIEETPCLGTDPCANLGARP